MGILTGWVVTIAGVVVLINVCEILMPEGEMNKYIKGICCIFISAFSCVYKISEVI